MQQNIELIKKKMQEIQDKRKEIETLNEEKEEKRLQN